MTLELLTTADPRWSAALGQMQHDFYHLPGYVELEAARMEGTAAALYASNDRALFLQPVVLRSLPFAAAGVSSDYTDASSPYGYPGPLLNGGTDFVDKLKAALPGFMSQRKLVSLFARLNPFINDPSILAGLGETVRHGEVICLDLTLPEVELHRQTRSRYRSYLNKLKADGVTARFDDRFEHYQTFIRLYYATMDNVGADTMYYFDQAYFDRLRAALGDRLKLVVIEQGETICATGLFVRTGDIIQYHLSGKNMDSGQPHATKAMMVFVRDWGKSVGAKYLHLGGGTGGRDDSLSHFKRGFSELTRPFYTWRMVGDCAAYDALLAEWTRRAGVAADGITGFFPPYRRPIPGSVG